MVQAGRALEFRAGQKLAAESREGAVDLKTDAAAKIAAVVGLGHYRLDLRDDDPTDAQTSVTFDVGWSGEAKAEDAGPARRDPRQARLRQRRHDEAENRFPHRRQGDVGHRRRRREKDDRSRSAQGRQ